MSDRNAAAFSQGLARQTEAGGIRPAEIAALILTVLWFAICLILWFRPSIDWSGPMVLIWITGLLVPIALIWLAVVTVRVLQELREEGQQLRAALAELRLAAQTPLPVAPDTGLSDRIDAMAVQQAALQGQLADLSEARQSYAAPAQPDAPAPEPQPSLSLGTRAEDMAAPVTIEEFIGALNFPENENDADGFQMLRKALQDRNTQKLVRSSQDVLTLLSQDGIYMDDLRPDRARPEVWRAFAQGERGRAIAGLGGVHDRSSLALASGRMRQDPVFRDAVHHFLRGFDQAFVEFERHANDQDIVNLANTRTARAFMLLGRVTGTFD